MSTTVATRRRLWIWGVAALLPLLMSTGIVWIIATPSGLHRAVVVANSLLDADLAVGTIEGRLLDQVVLHNLHYRDENSGVDVTVHTARLKLRLRDLLSRTIHLETAQLRGVVVTLFEPNDPASEPFVLPTDINIHLDNTKVNDLKIVRQQQALFALDQAELVATLIDGALSVQKMALRSAQLEADLDGSLRTANGYVGKGSGRVRWNQANRSWVGDFNVQADNGVAQLMAHLKEPAVAALEVTLPTEHRDTAPWHYRLEVPAIDPRGTFTNDDALKSFAAHLEGSGTLQQGNTAGQIAINGLAVDITSLHYARTASAVNLDGQLRVGGGSLDATGSIRTDDNPLSGTISASWRNVMLPASLIGQALRTDGKAVITGALENYETRGDITLWRQRIPTQVQMTVRGSPGLFQLDQLRITQPAGRLDAAGRIGVAGGVNWNIQAQAHRFNPGAIVSGWPGSLDFDLTSRGRLDGKFPVGQVRLSGLRGQLRGRHITGDAQLQLDPGLHLVGSAVVHSGRSRVQLDGVQGTDLAAQVQFDIATLNDWMPDTSGTLHGLITANGVWPDMSIAATATGTGLRVDQMQVDQLALDLRIANLQHPAGHATVSIERASLKNYALDSIDLTMDGDATRHQIALRSSGPRLSADFTAVGTWTAPYWRGHFDTLAVRLPDVAPFSHPVLQQPFDLQLSKESLQLSRTCLTQDRIHVCVEGDADAHGLRHAGYSVADLPVSMVNAFLPSGLPLQFEGQLNGTGNVTRDADETLSGSATIAMDSGRVLRTTPDGPVELTTVTALQVNAKLAGTHGEGRISAMIGKSGQVQGFVAVEGIGDITPAVSGQLTAQNLEASIVPLGLALRNGTLAVSADGSDRLQISGAVESGEGTMRFNGEVTTAGIGHVQLRGDRFLAVDIPGARLLATPDLELNRSAERMTLTGSVRIPVASFDVKKMPQSTSQEASPDVVVIDDPVPADKSRDLLPLYATVTVELGDKVKVAGYGLDASLDGKLVVTDRPGETTTGSGELRLQGTYAAYGRVLTIKKGQMLFAGTPLTNPRLDLSAVRTIGDVTAGLNVTGDAAHPEVAVFSEPAMAEADAISYLVAGRPLAQLGQGDNNTGALQSAARSLGIATSGVLAKNLGGKLGIGEFSVDDSAALGGAAFTVGRYLSPRLYVSYGVALFTPGEVVTLRYRLLDRLTIESENTQQSSRAGVKLRIER